MVVGTAALLAVAAVLALAVGTVLRRSAGAVTAVIVLIVAAVPPRGRRRSCPRAGAVAAAAHARPPPSPSSRALPSTPQVDQRLHAGDRLLPARAVGRLRRALRLDRGRAGRGRRAAAPEGRMRQALHAEWTKLRTVAGTGWLLLVGIVVLTVGAERRGGRAR